MATHRHKRDANARRLFTQVPRAQLIAGPLALVATLSAVGAGVLAASPATRDALTATSSVSQVADASRTPIVSRSGSRIDRSDAFKRARARAAEVRIIKSAHVKRWTTAPLNLWSDSAKQADQVGLLDSGEHVLVTGRSVDGRDEIVVDDHLRWVTHGYLAKDKPEADSASAAASTAGLSTAPCPDGSVESGLTSEAVLVYRAVCNAFPQITTYGGWDAHGEHSSGRALDIMTSDYALGNQIAAFLQAHSAELDLYDIIWWDRIWTPVRASEGWRDYGDYGSPTANHMDHVHVSTNG